MSDKPRIYWVYYPKLKRGYWRVMMVPLGLIHPQEREAWRFAHQMVQQMNERVGK